MKKLIGLALIVCVLVAGYNLLNTPPANSNYKLNNDLVRQVSANIPNYTPIDQIPDDFIKAIVAVEDRRFHKHHGFDIEAIGRAIYMNFKGGALSQGGSTITQQLAKNLFLNSDKTYDRKIKELAMAIKLERIYSKDEILEMYINVIYYGSDAYGIQAASQTYFGKNAADLTREECALLAGLPQAPSIYNPKINPALALKRQATVLSLMAQPAE